jgi:hypothetical protein
VKIEFANITSIDLQIWIFDLQSGQISKFKSRNFQSTLFAKHPVPMVRDMNKVYLEI